MKTHDSSMVNETSINQYMEQTRSSYSHMLKIFLQLYEEYDKIKTKAREEKLKGFFYPVDYPFYDEYGKINWKIIRLFMPPGMEKSIKEAYGLLNENEIRLCCLLFFKVPDKNIAKILIYKQKSIRVIKYIIKNKTGIRDIQEMFRKIIVKSV